MALALVLSARWRIVDMALGGPDKSYYIHRWLGFLALFGALAHWMLASSVGAGVLPILAESGEGVGTIAAIALAVLTGLAMVRAVPYHLWKLSHMAMGPIFLLAAYHTFFVASPLAVGAAPWTYMAIVSAIGLIAWLRSLWRKMSPTRLVKVESVSRFEGGIDLVLRSEKKLPPFRPGQFATLTHNTARAEAHPFTIAGGNEFTRRFIIRSAGDWTEELCKTVEAGQQLRLGRGVGSFLPKTNPKRPQQLWVAGGVGITPFLASLAQMEPDHGPSIFLVYCIRSHASSGVIEEVVKHCQRLPQVELHVFSEENNHAISIERLSPIVRSLSPKSQVYLCGPEGLKNLIINVCCLNGIDKQIHSERFDFRGAYGLSDLAYIGKPIVEAARSFTVRQKI